MIHPLGAGRSRPRSLAVGGALILGLLAPLALAQPSSAAPPTHAPAVDTAAPEACQPGAVARIPGPPPVLEAMGATPGSLPYTGKGVLVAIVDSGVDGSRPQLASAIVPGSTSLVSDDAQPDGLGDPFGHGTAVAGIIAARPESGSGVTGIAPEASIVSIRVFGSTDEQAKRDGTAPDADRLAAGISRATELGATIIVVAMSDDVDTQSLRDASSQAAARGSLIVASAGNRGTTAVTADSPRYPAAYPGALAVTAVTLSGRPTDDSIHGEHVDIAAPGQQVLTTATGAGDCVYSSDAPSSSFSTAYAAGTAALLAEAFPEEGPEGWIYRMQATADRPNPDARDDLIGWGRISPSAALTLRPDSSTRGPVSPFANTSGSSISRPRTQISRNETQQRAAGPAIIGGAAIAGVVLTLALTAQLRRRRSALRRDEAATHALTAQAAGLSDSGAGENDDSDGEIDDDHPYGPRDV